MKIRELRESREFRRVSDLLGAAPELKNLDEWELYDDWRGVRDKMIDILNRDGWKVKDQEAVELAKQRLMKCRNLAGFSGMYVTYVTDIKSPDSI